MQPLEIGVARFWPDGQLDPAFGRGGISSHVQSPHSFDVAGIAVQADGSIVVVGSAVDQRLREGYFALARFLPSGAPDPGFGNAGYLATSLRAGAYSFLQTADHKLVLAGRLFEGTIVARLLPSGELDAGFGATVIYRDARSHALTVHALTEQPDGKLVLAGSLRSKASSDSRVAHGCAGSPRQHVRR